jgi:hypothetical protein
MGTIFAPTVSAKKTTKEEKGAIGTPWGLSGDEVRMLSTDEIKELAKTNESIQKLIEEDMELHEVTIESVEDLSCIPDNYPKELKIAALNNISSNYITESSISIRTTNDVHIWVVADEEFRSYYGSNWETQAYNIIETADNKFYTEHNINFIIDKYTSWDSTDSEDSSSDLLKEAQREMDWDVDHDGCDMMAIFTNQAMDHRGLSESINYNGGDAWIMKHQISYDWDCHLAQHEASHNYGCPDHGYAGPYCIMSYQQMFCVDTWCNDCDDEIEDNRDHF